MTLTLPVVLVPAVITGVLLRSGGLKTGHAVVCALFGFSLRDSSVAPTLDDLTREALELVARLDL